MSQNTDQIQVGVTARLKLSYFVFQFEQMMVANMWSNYAHCVSKTEEIFIIPTTWTHRTADLMSNIKEWRWANEEWVRWRANVDIKFKGRNSNISWVELIMYCLVTSDFTEVEMLANTCFL